MAAICIEKIEEGSSFTLAWLVLMVSHRGPFSYIPGAFPGSPFFNQTID